ncbi:hypothetical protein BC826DRAFT_967724 [Russula brevipes]|nr:hypothetical protein BC826DRAFT_967724 [Russula brevipes]
MDINFHIHCVVSAECKQHPHFWRVRRFAPAVRWCPKVYTKQAHKPRHSEETRLEEVVLRLHAIRGWAENSQETPYAVMKTTGKSAIVAHGTTQEFHFNKEKFQLTGQKTKKHVRLRRVRVAELRTKAFWAVARVNSRDDNKPYKESGGEGIAVKLLSKRPRAVRNPSNNATPTPSKRANCLPVLPELSGEQDLISSAPSSTSSSSSSSCSSSASTPSRPTSHKEKRQSRYGRDQFAFGSGAFTITDDFLSAAPRAAPPPPSQPAKPMRQSVCLSAFDIVVDISTSEPASPVCEPPATFSTPPRRRDLRRLSPPRTRSPTPSLTSMSACSSTEMPITPGTSDDELPRLRRSQRARARPQFSIQPLVVTKSPPSLLTSEASPAETYEFTLVSFLPGLEEEAAESEEDQEEEHDEDDLLWYSHELSAVVSVSSPCALSSSPARRDSIPPPPRSSSSRTDRPAGRSRMSKPLPTLPHSPAPISQLDPTFPRSKPCPLPLPLRASLHPTTLPSPLALPSPVAFVTAPETRKLSPLKSAASRASMRRSLTISVPRALPRTPLPLDVSELLNDADVWSFPAPPSSTSTVVLSPPRVPRSPAPSVFSEYDPIELIVSYATQPPSPSPSTVTTTTAFHTATSVAFPEEEAASAEVEGGEPADDDDKLRSRWSCSTLATLAPPGSPQQTPTSTSARLRFHLGSVARRVRARRAAANSGSAGAEDAMALSKADILFAPHLYCVLHSLTVFWLRRGHTADLHGFIPDSHTSLSLVHIRSLYSVSNPITRPIGTVKHGNSNVCARRQPIRGSTVAIIQLISASLSTGYNAHVGGARPLNRPITVIFLPIFTHLTPGLKARHPRRVLACNFYYPRALLAVLTLHCQPACETCSLEKVETPPRSFRRRGGASALPPGTISSRCSSTERKSQTFTGGPAPRKDDERGYRLPVITGTPARLNQRHT